MSSFPKFDMWDFYTRDQSANVALKFGQGQRIIAYAESEKKKRLQEVGVTPEIILQKVVLDNRQIKKVALDSRHAYYRFRHIIEVTCFLTPAFLSFPEYKATFVLIIHIKMDNFWFKCQREVTVKLKAKLSENFLDP